MSGFDPPASRRDAAGMQGVSVSIRSVSRAYGRGAREAVLQGITLEVGEGEVILLTGPSGCGKTTLLNLVAGLDRPSSGQIFVGEEEIGRMPEATRAAWRAETVGTIFQHHLIPPGQTALESVALPLIWHQGTTRAGARRIAAEWLEKVGLANVAGQRVERLSGGQRQRIAIARALASNPPLILADEPTAHLDVDTGSEITAILHDHVRDSGATMLVVSHEHDPADWGATRAYTIRGGKLVGKGGS